jgi:hypothetical protein|tara:strand:+ start:10199 stop:10795 length:597 start_codon:yes stop_codon:yes gene_type:complete
MVEILGAGAWALVDQDFLQRNAVWFVAIGLAGLIIAWFWDEIADYREWRKERGKPRVEQWMFIDDAVKYLADFPLPEDLLLRDPNFPIRVSNALKDRLVCGDLRARGRPYNVLRGGIQDPPRNPLNRIDAEVWQTAQIEAYFVLQGVLRQVAAGRHTNVVMINDHEGFHDVVVSRNELEDIWPTRGALRPAKGRDKRK